MKEKRVYILHKFLKSATILLLLLVVLFLGILFVLNIPAVQTYAAQQAAVWLSQKTGATISLHKVNVKLPNKFSLKQVLAIDLNGDTLLYVNELDAGIKLTDLWDKKITINQFVFNGGALGLYQNEQGEFNFNFLTHAFAANSQAQIDTTPASNPLVFQINEFNLSQFKFVLNSKTTGLNLAIQTKSLQFRLNQMRFDTLLFDFADLNALETFVDLSFFKPSKVDTSHPVTKSLLPVLLVNQVKLSNCGFTFNNPLAKIYFSSKVQKLSATFNAIDLNKELVDVNKANIDGATVYVGLGKTMLPSTESENSLGYRVISASTQLNNSEFKLDFLDEPAINGFDYNHLNFTQVKAQVNQFAYSSKQITGNVVSATLKDKCGLEIRHFKSLFFYNDNGIELAQLYLKTNHSVITNYLSVTYPSTRAVAANPNLLGLKANFKQSKIALSECLMFNPGFKKYSPAFESPLVLTIDGKLGGTMGNLTATNLHLLTQNQSYLTLNGNMLNLLDVEQTHLAIDVPQSQIYQSDLEVFLGTNNIKLPKQIGGKINWVGGYKKFVTQLDLYTNDENLVGYASVNLVQNQEAVELNLHTKKLNLGYWLNTPIVGFLSGKIQVNASQYSSSHLNLKSTFDLNELVVKQVPFKQLQVKTNIANGQGTIECHVDDTKLKLKTDAEINLPEEALSWDLNLFMADLLALKITDYPLRLSTQNNTNFTGFKLQHVSGNSRFTNTQLATLKQKYKLQQAIINANQNGYEKTLNVSSDLIDLNLKSTENYDSLLHKTQLLFSQYFDTTNQATMQTGMAELTVWLKTHPFLQEVLLPKLTDFDGLQLQASAHFNQNTLKLATNVEQVIYDGIFIKGFDFLLSNQADSLVANLTLKQANWQNYKVPTVLFRSSLKQGAGFSKLAINADSLTRILVYNNWHFYPNETQITFTQNELILNDSTWSLPPSHAIKYNNHGWFFDSVHFKNNQSSFGFTSLEINQQKALGVLFNSFNMSHISQLVENDTAIFRGFLNGNFTLFQSQDLQFVSDLNLTEFSYRNKMIGDVHLLASSNEPEVYQLKLAVTHLDNKAVLQGLIEKGKLNLEADIEKFSMQTLDAISMGYLKDGNGYAQGDLIVTGTFKQPTIVGKINFVDASTIITSINSRIKLSNQNIIINSEGAQFNHFVIQDSTDQPLVVNGKINAVSATLYQFDLNVVSKNFKLLNTTKKDNEVIYGSLVLNSEIEITGNSDLPIVNAKLQVLKGSNLTFVVQPNEVKLDIGEDVVTIIDKDTNAYLNLQDSFSTQTQITGIDFSASLQVDNLSTLTIILDQTSGDKIIAKGDANLNFTIDKSGKTTMLGTYTLDEGAYYTSFQKIIKREFQIIKGSSIDWTGDPLSGNINITAVYKVKTSAQDLLSAEIAGMTEEERNAYRKLLNYKLNLITKGQILKPDLHFLIELEDKDKNAFGGMVDAKLAAVNNDPNELNKQVFSLLILNKFLPPNYINNSAATTSGSAMSAASTIARNSVNQILTDQLNALSSKHVKGAELNFNIQANDNYTSTGTVEQATEFQVGLKKELFNEKLSVQVGSSINMSQSTTATSAQYVTGDIIVEYKLTDDGKYKLKAFRENNYEGLMDGMLYKTGLGLVLGKDFNKFSEVFKIKQDSVGIKKDTVK